MISISYSKAGRYLIAMARLLYDDGNKVGEISDWTQRNEPAAYKTFLGKTALMSPANDLCSFTSPKPVHRKAKLTVVEDSSVRYVLEVLKVVGGTEITAKIKEKIDLK
jgi:hypothetical protein